MHRHSSPQTASRCSRFCLANYNDRAYYERHGHTSEAPTPGCYWCGEDKQKAEERRRTLERTGGLLLR